MSQFARLPVSKIFSGSCSTQINVDRVTELADSINRLGLLQPLVVVPKGNKFKLIAGRHRFAAVQNLKWSRVECLVVDLDKARQELAEIDENLIRKSLSYLERAELISRRADLLEAIGHQHMGITKGKQLRLISTYLNLSPRWRDDVTDSILGKLCKIGWERPWILTDLAVAAMDCCLLDSTSQSTCHAA